MRHAFCVALCVVALFGLASVSGEYPKAWISLFQPPYENCPELAMSIGCVANDTCYIPAFFNSNNPASIGLFKFDGEMNGKLTSVDDPANPTVLNFLLQVAVGGTKEKPQGAVGGVGWWYGLKYFVGPNELFRANTTPFVETADIRADPTGKQVLLVNGFEEHGWGGLYSTDGGINYKSFLMIQGTVPNPSCTIPSFVSIAADNTWYVVASAYPTTNASTSSSGSSSSGLGTPVNHKGDKNLRYYKSHIALLRKGSDMAAVLEAGFQPNPRAPMQVRRSPLKAHNDWVARGRPVTASNGSVCGYGSSILKTTDGGSTWTNYNFDSTEWSLQDIDCLNATNCVAVGFGPTFGSVIVRTTDGSTWSTVLTIPGNTQQFTSLNAVRYNPVNPMDIWVGGSFETSTSAEAVFYHSVDGGASWSLDGTVEFVVEVLQISFAPDGTAFAVAVTQFSVTTILRYTYYGPPATPAPAWNGAFTQVVCTDANCSVNCQTVSFAQNACLNLTNGLSATAVCDMTDQALLQNVFLEPKCAGQSELVPLPLNACLENEGGGSFYTVCGPVTQPPQGSRVGRALQSPRRNTGAKGKLV